MSDWDRRANEIFLDALERIESARGRFIEEACGDDSALRCEVEALLEAAAEASGFIEQPVVTRPSADFEFSEPLPLFEGKYRLDEKIGAGGMGVVYAATQSAPIVRRVAVKLIRNDADDEALLARFELERQTLAVMDHSNIAKVFDAGTTAGGQPYLVMEYIPGVPLVEYCDLSRLSLIERLALFLDVCRGLHHAHQKGVVHRDLKPSNVLVSDADGRPTPKIIDFGVAKVIGRRLTERTVYTGQSMLIGTLEYMAPEQTGLGGADARDIDIRCDVYSIGVILYELLAGLRPFERERLKKATLDEAVRILRDEDPPSLSKRLRTHPELDRVAAERRSEPRALIAAVEGDLNWIVMRCLSKDREARYASANDLANDVRRFLNHEPIEARPTSSLYRFRKLIRRRRGLAIATSLLTLSLIGGTVGTTLGFLRAERAFVAQSNERANAERARDDAWDALDAMTSSVTETVLAGQPELTSDQKQFLASALASYRKLSEETGTDEASLKRTAAAARRVGRIESILGNETRAAAAFGAAADLYANLSAQFPNERTHRQFLARSHCGMALSCWKIGRHAEERHRLELAVSTMTSLLEEQPDEPAFRSDLATYSLELGIHFTRHGDYASAEEPLKAAQTLLMRLIEEQPEIRDHRIDLARYHNVVANGWRQRDRRDEAEKHFRRAVELREAADPEGRGAPSLLASLAADHNNLGTLLCRMGGHAAGISHLQKGLAIQGKLVERFPSAPDYRRKAAMFALNLARPMGETGDRREERRLLESAIASLERLVVDYPNMYDVDLAGAHCNMGVFLREDQRPAESIGWFDKAIATLERQRRTGDDSVQCKQYLRNSVQGRATSLFQLGRWSLAADDWKKTMELAAPDEQPSFQLRTLYCLAKADRTSDAVSMLDRLPQDHPWDAERQYGLACALALLAAADVDRRNEFSTRAMDALASALRKGLAAPAKVLRHKDLTSLQRLAAFQDLLRRYPEVPAKANQTPRA